MMFKLHEWYKKRRMFKTTYNELNRLSDYELADLGLDRSMIEYIAKNSSYGSDKNVFL